LLIALGDRRDRRLWSLLLLFAVKHLALVAVAAGPLYAAFGDRLFKRRKPAPET